RPESRVDWARPDVTGAKLSLTLSTLLVYAGASVRCNHFDGPVLVVRRFGAGFWARLLLSTVAWRPLVA
ncbi:MAG: hypothetical protein O7G83_22335, partial [Proteobacteria bacterium]|nr:hypothetical protein [Pseudomonadota bacterium]